MFLYQVVHKMKCTIFHSFCIIYLMETWLSRVTNFTRFPVMQWTQFDSFSSHAMDRPEGESSSNWKAPFDPENLLG